MGAGRGGGGVTCSCGRPVDGAALCAGCVVALEVAVADLSAYWQDLDNVRAGLVRYGGQGGRTMDHRLPIDPRFAESYWEAEGDWIVNRIPHGTALLEAVRNTVGTWVRVVLDDNPVITGPVCAGACLHLSCAAVRRSMPPADTVASCCRYLLRNTTRIRVADWAQDLAEELGHVSQQLRFLVDRPADRWYAGPCDQCERDLYARTGAAEVVCAECDLAYDVAARRQWLLEQAEDRLVNATMLARAVSWLGSEPLTAERVRKWAQRGRLIAKGHEVRAGRTLPLYRIGDALDLLAGESEKVG